MPYLTAFSGNSLAYRPLSQTALSLTAPPRRLLLVGKDERAIAAVAAHFFSLGWQVDCALELEEAEALLSCRSYTTVVTDLSLSGADGPAGLKIISQVRARCPRARVFLWTSYYNAQLAADAREVGGVDGFLHKLHPVADLARAVCAKTEKFYA